MAAELKKEMEQKYSHAVEEEPATKPSGFSASFESGVLATACLLPNLFASRLPYYTLPTMR